MMSYLLAAVVLILFLMMVLFIVVSRTIGNGTKIPLGKGQYFRRWVGPTDPGICKYIVNVMQGLCKDSVGSLLPHPAVQGNIKELYNKTVLVAYSMKNQPIMFNMMIQTDSPPGIDSCTINHLGLVIVSSSAKGKGLQALTMLNAGLQFISLRSLKIHITDVGDSPSAFRLTSTYLSDPFPDYNIPNKKAGHIHVQIFKHMLKMHRKDMGISANAIEDFNTFVVKYSNEPTGGGSEVLAAYAQERYSNTKNVNRLFYKMVNPKEHDELFIVGTLDLVCLRRAVAGLLFKNKM